MAPEHWDAPQTFMRLPGNLLGLVGCLLLERNLTSKWTLILNRRDQGLLRIRMRSVGRDGQDDINQQASCFCV